MMAARVLAVLAVLLAAGYGGFAFAPRGAEQPPPWTDVGRVVCPPAEPCYFEQWEDVVPLEPEAPPGEPI